MYEQNDKLSTKIESVLRGRAKKRITNHYIKDASSLKQGVNDFLISSSAQ